MKNYWIAVISHEHAKRAIKESIIQVCHGKSAPLARLKPGDSLLIYSPKELFQGSEPCQKFTALGEVADNNIYQFDMGSGFVPYRRKIIYQKNFTSIPIRPLINQLSFIKNKTSWGMAFRYGLIKLPELDFKLIIDSHDPGAR